jgi:hypothetical protein
MATPSFRLTCAEMEDGKKLGTILPQRASSRMSVLLTCELASDAIRKVVSMPVRRLRAAGGRERGKEGKGAGRSHFQEGQAARPLRLPAVARCRGSAAT